MSEENNGVDCLGIYSGTVKYFGNHITYRWHRMKTATKFHIWVGMHYSTTTKSSALEWYKR